MPFPEVTQLGIAELIGWAISLLGIFTTIVFGLVKLLLNQMEKRMTERDQAQENAFSKLIERQDKDAEALRQLEKSFLRFQADLPLQYVRREDYVRNQTIIEAKLDALASKLELIQIRGKAHD
ncbi:hypothetical protein SAMN05216588_12621 [Pseudomonas flavescens]|uniref:Uncharacterized protein n=1 Tax=Phytopseudomonas flavescens TaxID=29435 RepID=A0A1G8NUN3_9GAMM|nr:hypothetical protein [Pseudomonas flavescens]SDI83907.1 hypothetical protein SAMN05216588_12621 [Pseudomonas flavescens]